jgi:hypothetical protein
MNHSTLVHFVRSTALASAATALMLAALIIAGEESPALKNVLKATFYHHWLGKGALAIALFVLLSFALGTRRSETPLFRIIMLEAFLAALSALAIAGFFLLRTLGLV